MCQEGAKTVRRGASGPRPVDEPIPPAAELRATVGVSRRLPSSPAHRSAGRAGPPLDHRHQRRQPEAGGRKRPVHHAPRSKARPAGRTWVHDGPRDPHASGLPTLGRVGTRGVPFTAAKPALLGAFRHGETAVEGPGETLQALGHSREGTALEPAFQRLDRAGLVHGGKADGAGGSRAGDGSVGLAGAYSRYVRPFQRTWPRRCQRMERISTNSASSMASG